MGIFRSARDHFHSARLGEAEHRKRTSTVYALRSRLENRDERFDPPPIGWRAFELLVDYWELTCHRNLCTYNALFREPGIIRYELECECGPEPSAEDWLAFQHERSHSREQWERIAARFEAWAEIKFGADCDAADPDDEARDEDAYSEALALLGLSEPYDQADLKRAHRAAIRKAHPDLGGSTEQAQAVNAAKALLIKRNGW